MVQNNYMEANAAKFQAIILNETNTHTFNIDGTIVKSEDTVRLLGVKIDSKLNFTPHIKDVCRKAAAQLSVLQRLQSCLDKATRLQIFKTFIVSQFQYCSIVWHFCGEKNTTKMERLQYRALKFVFRDKTSSYPDLLARANVPSLRLSRERALLLEVYKAVRHISPIFMRDLFKEKTTGRNLRNKKQLVRTIKRTNCFGLNTFQDYGAKLWNSIPNEAKDLNIENFRKWLNTWNGAKQPHQ